MKHPGTTAVVLGMLLAGEGVAAPPKVVRHPTPPLSVDARPFADAGCIQREKGAYACAPGTELGKLGCEGLFVSDLLGGLEPAHPIADCHWRSRKPVPPGEFVHGPKGILPIYTRYVIFEGGRYRLLKTADALRQEFAPITSASEAFSFALMVTGLEPFFDFEPSEKLHYEVATLEDTYVDEESTGFIVHNLADRKVFGCGPHPTYLVDFRVSRDGHVTELRRQKAFRDPSADTLCVD